MTDEKKKRSKQVHVKTKDLEPGLDVKADLAEETADLQEEIGSLQNQCKEYFEGWQRERADFLNYKKRIEREQAQLHEVVAGNTIKKFLAVLDDMDRALRNRPADAEQQEWWSGIELIYRKLQNILEAEGIEPVATQNDDFDPNRHEAISHEDHPQVESGKVIEVLQQGYRIGDRLIRPALVRVAR